MFLFWWSILGFLKIFFCVLTACDGILRWQPVVVACNGSLRWYPEMAACGGSLRWQPRWYPAMAACGGSLQWQPAVVSCDGSLRWYPAMVAAVVSCNSYLQWIANTLITARFYISVKYCPRNPQQSLAIKWLKMSSINVCRSVSVFHSVMLLK